MATKTAATKTPATTTAKATDRFGSRIGTKTHRINEALSSRKAKTMQELVEEAKLKDTYYNHLARLVEAGLVKKEKDGRYIAVPLNQPRKGTKKKQAKSQPHETQPSQN